MRHLWCCSDKIHRNRTEYDKTLYIIKQNNVCPAIETERLQQLYATVEIELADGKKG